MADNVYFNKTLPQFISMTMVCMVKEPINFYKKFGTPSCPSREISRKVCYRINTDNNTTIQFLVNFDLIVQCNVYLKLRSPSSGRTALFTLSPEIFDRLKSVFPFFTKDTFKCKLNQQSYTKTFLRSIVFLNHT